MTENLMPLSYQRNPNLENCKVFIQTHKEAQEISKHFAQIQAELITTLEAILQIVELKNTKWKRYFRIFQIQSKDCKRFQRNFRDWFTRFEARKTEYYRILEILSGVYKNMWRIR